MKEFLKEFGITEVPKAQLVNRSYFIVEDRTLLSRNPLYIGECIAHQRGDKTIPSIDFLQHIGKQAKKHVYVDEKGEWLFICGRDLASKYIVNHNNPEMGDKVVVLNEHKECIGYGKLIAPLTHKKDVIKREFDIGDLLRRERKAKRF